MAGSANVHEAPFIGFHPNLPMNTPMKLLLLVTLLTATPAARARAADAETAAVMRQKLAVAQRILGGLATADFALIQTNANTLIQLSGQRGWTAMQTPDYELFSTQFRVSAEALAKAAKVRDVDAAVNAYSDMTVSCVACHKYLRASPKKVPASKP